MRRFAAAIGAIAIQLLVINIIISIDTERLARGAPETRSFTWLYLSPLVPADPIPEIEVPDPPEVAMEPPIAVFETPVPDPYTLRLEDLEILSVPTLRVRPPGTPGAGSIGLGLGNFFSCNLTGYSTLSEEERESCAERLALLRRERDLANPDALLSVLTAQELAQWSQWQRQQRDQSGPMLLPCMSGSSFLSINLATLDCVVNNLTGGYDPANNPPDRYGEEEAVE